MNKFIIFNGKSIGDASPYFIFDESVTITAYNLPPDIAVRFEKAVVALISESDAPPKCDCILSYDLPDVIGHVPLRCESCHEEDGYVQLTSDNPTIILDFPRKEYIRAFFVNRYTSERIQDAATLISLYSTVNVYATTAPTPQPRTPSNIGCAPFCPPTPDWAIDCETMGWTQPPENYPEEWFTAVSDCGKVTAIDATTDPPTATTEPSQVIGYLLEEPKWWANKAVRDCCGELLGYGMPNEGNDCPSCCTDPIQVTPPPQIPCQYKYYFYSTNSDQLQGITPMDFNNIPSMVKDAITHFLTYDPGTDESGLPLGEVVVLDYIPQYGYVALDVNEVMPICDKYKVKVPLI